MACEQHNSSKSTAKSKWSFLSALLLVILPKCPYCFVAYSSAITICGIPGEHSSSWEQLFILGLVGVIVTSMLLAYRGRQTLIALTVALIGTGAMLYGSQSGALSFYHVGAVLMLLSTFMNRRVFYKGLLAKMRLS